MRKTHLLTKWVVPIHMQIRSFSSVLPQQKSTSLPMSKVPTFIVYYGTFVDTPKLGHLRVRTNTSIGVSLLDGKIKFINENTKDPLNEAMSYDPSLSVDQINIVDTFDYESTFFFPGFIDTHIHAPQYPNAGLFGNSTLLDWLQTYTFPLENSLKDLDVAKKVYTKVVKRTLTNGTTCASYYATIDSRATNLLADLCLKFGQKAFIGKVCMNDNSPEFYTETMEESQLSTMAVIEHIARKDPQRSMVQPIITPRFAPSCTSELLHWLAGIREKYGLACQTHLSENKQEIEWVAQLFPNSKSYTNVYDDHNLLCEKTILAHSIHLSEEESELIAERKSGVSHCPISNSSLNSGECRVRWLLDKGIKVGLGTDMSAGFSPSILSTARQSLLVSRHLAMSTEQDHDKLSVVDVLFLSTMGGAQVVNLADQIGCFDVGKQFDAQQIDLETDNSNIDIFDWQYPRWGNDQTSEDVQKFEDLLAKWLFNGDDRNTVRVWTNGQLVHSV